MARVTRNSLLRGISGKLGTLVVRQVGDQTIVQAAEAPGPRAPRSPAQQAHLDRMYPAQCYAKAQVQDPAAKARYATGIDQRRTSAYTVAVADFMNPPVITALLTTRYHGQPHDVLIVAATDDFAVAAVHVSICSPAGVLLEAGPATPQPDGRWHYLAQTTQPALPGLRLEAEARDYAGNVVSYNQVL
jgi:hypothetical protein